MLWCGGQQRNRGQGGHSDVRETTTLSKEGGSLDATVRVGFSSECKAYETAVHEPDSHRKIPRGAASWRAKNKEARVGPGGTH